MTDEQIDAVSKALRRAWQLGQTYWQQADSESWTQQAKSDETQKKFDALVDETRAMLESKPAVAETDAPQLRAIHTALRTQDNRITAAPMFAVQERKRVYGIDTDYDPKIVWTSDEGHEADAEEAAELEAGYDDDGETQRGEYRRVGYHEYWEFVTACFTEQGCKDYIARNGHNLNETRIYAYGTYRNAEWSLIRDFLMSDAFAASPAAPAQSEPVAWMVLSANTRQPCEVTIHKSETESLRQDCVVPLFAAPPPAKERGLTIDQLQQKAIDHGFQYWRASDAHGVVATREQATELLQDLLGVEVDIDMAAAQPQPAGKLAWWASERGMCKRESHCECGGDAWAVRETCDSWSKRPGVAAHPTSGAES